MKLFEHPTTDKTLDRLPELPAGVKVPDDLSGIHPPTTLRPTSRGVRWMRWLAAVVLLGAAGVVAAVLLRGDGTEPAPADRTEVGDMQLYGTDNPAFVDGSAGPGTVLVVSTPDDMQLYGTDNPVFVRMDTGEFMRLYGTDNPVVVPADTGEFMRLYGTDNPVVVPEATFMDLYGTDNPVVVPQAEDPVDTGELMRLYGTDNPEFVEP